MGGFSPESKPKREPRERRGVLMGALLLLGGVAVFGLQRLREDSHAPTPEPSGRARQGAAEQANEEQLRQLVGSVVEDVNAVWARDFQRRGKPYAAAKPVLLEDGDSAVCGLPGGQLGRAGCGTNEAYVDLSFQRDLSARHGAAADAARAYAVAHEMGHHLQRVLGIDAKVEELLASRPVSTHAVQVQLELQADCLAGVWSRSTKQRHALEPNVIETALRQASELGTERSVARRDGEPGYSESFTYAIPRRRIYWFQVGFAAGELQSCDTFAP